MNNIDIHGKRVGYWENHMFFLTETGNYINGLKVGTWKTYDNIHGCIVYKLVYDVYENIAQEIRYNKDGHNIYGNIYNGLTHYEELF